MVELGPVTAALEDEVKGKLRQHGIVVWLDKDGHYTSYVDQLAERYASETFPFPVVSFRGSYLELLFKLEPYGNGDFPDRVLIHMPGHINESIRKTPLLELYEAGKEYNRALGTIIRNAATGKVPPDAIEAYLNNGVSDLAAADHWLATVISQPQDDLSTYFNAIDLEWILEGLVRGQDAFKAKLNDESSRQQLLDHLYRRTGLDSNFVCFYHGGSIPSFQELGEICAAWLMCVEYVHDLARLPNLPELQPIKELSPPLVKTCEQLVKHLRERQPDIYVRLANTVEETRLKEELSQIRPEDLGKIDTFKGEETAILKSAITALQNGRWQQAQNWADTRNQAASFWLQRDPTRRIEWSLIKDAANLGCLIAAQSRPLKGTHTLRDALDYYTQAGHEVDNAHRRFEQQRLKLLESSLPHFNELYEVANQLRVDYRAWADALATDFATLCESEGFLPETDLQQRTLYDQVVHPLTQQSKGKVAYFLVDAFRYEMAAELMPELKEAGAIVDLKGRFAELPTLTSVGMNVLAPVNQSGKLVLTGQKGFKGFKTGEYTVNAPDNRARAMGERSVDNVSSGRRRSRLMTLNEVCDRSITSLKQSCADADLIVVHSKEIDDAGEANVGLFTFEESIRQLKSAWNHLKSAGIQHFVFTADHGFLLQDQTTRMEAKYGTKRDPERRHVLSDELRREEGCVTLPLAALNYEGQDGYLLFRRDTAVFAKGKGDATFVHGGNSLQERVIPVLTVSHRHKAGNITAQYVIEVEALAQAFNCNRLRLRLQPAPESQGVLQFSGSAQINLALRVPDREDITVLVKEVIGATIKNQIISITDKQDWVEVFFDLAGSQTERVRVEVFHPDRMEQVEPAAPVEFFDVSSQGTPEPTKPEPVTTSPDDWQNSFEDESIRRIFVHLQQHGSITEVEMTQMLGNARQVRRFARDFETYLSRIPFSVRIETAASGKRYVKDI